MYNVLLFVTNFHVPIIVSFNPQTIHQPRFHNQCQPGPIWGIRSPLRTSLHLLNTLYWNLGVVGHLPPTLESGWRGETYFIFLRHTTHTHNTHPPTHTHTLSDPFIKLDPRLCSILLRHCSICFMYSKHRIGRKAVELLEI